MHKRVVVISDLHLGGDQSFQLCGLSAQKRLTAFFEWLRLSHTRAAETHLVLAGDVVDFLAETPWQAFTDNETAKLKLSRILERTRPVWDALKALVESGTTLTILVGNHDIELCLPGPEGVLREFFKPVEIDIKLDDQPLLIGPVLIDHGNRYDSWNVVRRDILEELRNELINGHLPQPFPTVPGSELVVQVMNPLKQNYPFIDSLKPETYAAIPLLAILNPRSLADLNKVVRFFRQYARTLPATGFMQFSDDLGLISSGAESDKAEEALNKARRLVGQNEVGFLSDVGTFREIWQAIRAGRRGDKVEQLDRMLQALRYAAENINLTYDLYNEEESYLNSAKEAATRGHSVIVYGHTHLAKSISLGYNNAMYFNAGTWGNVLKIPSEVLEDCDQLRARVAIERFADALIADAGKDFLEQHSTFVQIDLQGGSVSEACLFSFEDSERIKVLKS